MHRRCLLTHIATIGQNVHPGPDDTLIILATSQCWIRHSPQVRATILTQSYGNFGLGAEQAVGDQPDEHGQGEVGAQQVLGAFSGGGRGADPAADPAFGNAKAGFEDGGSGGKNQAGDAGFGVVGGGQGADGLDGDVGASRKKLTATSCWARRSAVRLASRIPVRRQYPAVMAAPIAATGRAGGSSFRRDRRSPAWPIWTFSRLPWSGKPV
jgi:hypothetical protein